MIIEPNDTIFEATVTDLSSDNPGSFFIEEFIGDNPEIFFPENDVDFFEVQLDAGSTLTVDIDAEEFGSTLDSVLRLFDSFGNELIVSDDDPAPGEEFLLDSYLEFTADFSDTYYVGVSSYSNFDYDPFLADSGFGSSTGDYAIEISVSEDNPLIGTPDNDLIIGTANDDVIEGLAGRDTLRGGSGRDTINGGSGNDRIFGQGGADILRGASGRDTINGGSGNDRIFGQGGADILRGASGNDLLNGGGANDRIFGQGGNDTLKGGNGNDFLNGGNGADLFVFDELNSSIDEIADFDYAEGDLIQIGFTGSENIGLFTENEATGEIFFDGVGFAQITPGQDSSFFVAESDLVFA